MRTSIKSFHLSFFAVLFLLFVSTIGYTAETKSSPPVDTTATQKTDAEKKAAAEAKAKKEAQEKKDAEEKAAAAAKALAEKNQGNRVMPNISERTIQIISVLFFVIMLFLFYYFFEHIRRNRQRIGFQSIKLIGLILMFPGICIIALVGNGLIGGSTLAALLGTIAGYVLSKEDDPKKTTADKTLDDLKEENGHLMDDINNLKKEIEKLKK